MDEECAQSLMMDNELNGFTKSLSLSLSVALYSSTSLTHFLTQTSWKIEKYSLLLWIINSTITNSTLTVIDLSKKVLSRFLALGCGG